jgi:hypothetical protein
MTEKYATRKTNMLAKLGQNDWLIFQRIISVCWDLDARLGNTPLGYSKLYTDFCALEWPLALK